MNWTINTNIDLDDITTSRMIRCENQLFAGGDKKAHTWKITVNKGGAAASLSGYSAKMYLKTPDDDTEIVNGTIAANVVTFDFDEPAYEMEGAYIVTARIVKTGEVVTLAAMTYDVRMTVPIST